MSQRYPGITHRRQTRSPKGMGTVSPLLQPDALQRLPQEFIRAGFVNVVQSMSAGEEMRVFAPGFNRGDVRF